MAPSILKLPSVIKEPLPVPVVNQRDIPTTLLTQSFTLQSYLSTSLLQNAILQQAINDPIVQSTARVESLPGYGIALLPTSQTPVTVQLLPGTGQASTAKILKPGETWWPTLLGGHPFSGIRWGLPFGWLGGGVATIVVIHTPGAKMDFSAGSPEIIFHRVTVKILADAAPAGYPAIVKNWPIRFPWPDAAASLSAAVVAQAGSPIIAVTPTRVVARLRLQTLAAPLSMRAVFRGDLDFDQKSDGTIDTAVATGIEYVDVSWPQATTTPDGKVPQATGFPVQEFNSAPWLFGAEGGGLHLFDNTNAALTNAFVDFVRYGRLG